MMGTRIWVYITIVLSVLFLKVQKGYAQIVAPGYTYEYWTQREGLPTNGISDVKASGNGYVWLSTYNGLVRFNGIVDRSGELFTTFNKSNTPGFSSNRFFAIHILSDNEFFLRSEPVAKVENLIQYKNGVITSYGTETGFVDAISGVSIDEDQNFWIVNDGRLLRFEEGKWIHELPDIDVGFVRGLDVVNKNDIWLKTASSLWHIYDGVVDTINTKDGLSSDFVVNYSIGASGKVWVATDKGIDLIEDGQIKHIALPDDSPSEPTGNMEEDKTNPERTIINLMNGQKYIYYKGQFQLIPLSLVDDDTGELLDFELIGSENDTLNESRWLNINEYLFHNDKLVFKFNYVIAKYSGNTGNSFWNTEENKLYRIRKSDFRSLTPEKNNVGNVYSLTKDRQGYIWGTGVGEQIYRGNAEEPFTRFDLEYGISKGRAFSVLEDSKGNMWFGLDDAIAFWDRASQPEFLDLPFNSINVQVRGIYEDVDGMMWFGSRAGVHSLNSSREWIHYPLEGAEEEPSIRLIYQDRNGQLWFGTNGYGLVYLDKESNTLKEFEHNDLLLDPIIRSIYQDEEGILWVGTEGAGLYRINPNSSNPDVTHYDQTTGLFGGVIHAILEDNDSRLWMSSNQGIFWVQRSNLNDFSEGRLNQITSVVYDDSDGLPGTEANGGMQSTGIATSTGEFLFPMVGGIAIVNPDEVESGTEGVSTRIEELITNDTSYIFIDQGQLSLSKEQRNLQFRYVGYNNDINPNNIRFRYKLEGYDDDWQNVGSRREAFYTSVPAGDYTFTMQASVFGSDWEKSSSSTAVSIAPYFYETAFFYVICTMLVGLIGFLLYRQRIHTLEEREKLLSRKVDEQTSQLKEQAERLKELDKAKSRFFANISHEFRTPLTLTIGPLEDIRKTDESAVSTRIRKKASLALRNSKRLLRLVNQILDISKIETRHMTANVSKQDLVGFIKPIAQAFISLAEKKEIQYTIDFSSEVLPLWFDADMMEKIIGNLLSNAFKFTPAKGSITFGLNESENEQVVIKVSDSGVGIPEEELQHVFERFYQTGESVSNIQAGTGIGLSLVKELVDLHKGEIKVESEVGKGTVFTVSLKKGKDHFEEEQFSEVSHPETVPEVISLDLIEEFETIEPTDQRTVGEENPRVLLIDDNEEIRSYIREFIDHKYHVFETENGSKGLELAREELPDVIICDVMMPVMDGYEFVKQLKGSKETDFIPVIMLTAKAEQTDKLEGLGLGANDYIVKPFDIEEVLLKVDNLITSQKKIKSRFSSVSYNLNIETESAEARFLETAIKAIEENIDNEDFGVDQFAEAMLVSRAVLYTKMKEVAGKTPSEFIWGIRLEHAAELIRQKAGNITQIAYSVGFKSIAHFSRSFKKKFDATPRAYLKSKEAG